MNKKKAFLALIAALFFTIGVLIASWMFESRASGPFQRLKNGMEMRLEKVTYGKHHQFTLRSTTRKIETESDSAVFWFSLRNFSPNDDRGFCNQVIFDELGHQITQGVFKPIYMTSSRPFLGWFNLKDPTSIAAFTLDAFPRRGKTVGIRLYTRESDEPVAEFTAPNPTPGPHPVWTPETYPITRNDGPLAFTLTGLDTGLLFCGTVKPALPGQFASTCAIFRISNDGKPAKEWEPVRVVFSDATGNQVINEIARSNSGPRYNDTGEIETWLYKNLCADESVWKLNVEFSRTFAARFSPDEIWLVKNIRAPQQDELIRLGESDSRQGARVRLVGIAGTGIVEWSPGNTTSNYLTEIRARVSLPCDGLRLTLTAKDDSGRIVMVSNTGYKDVPVDDEREYSFHLQVPSDASTLDLQFALHKSRFAEFLAHPSKP